MTSFGFWQDMAAAEGRFLCMICFEGFAIEHAYQDQNGDKWDICTQCHKLEEAYERTHRNPE